MNDKSKLILKVGLITYSVIVFLRVLDSINGSIFGNTFSVGLISLDLISIILFAYVLNHGEEKTAMAGIYSVIARFVFSFLLAIGVFKTYSYEPLTFIDILFRTLYYTSDSLITLFACMALFALIKTEDDKILIVKKVAIGLLIAYVFFGFLSDIFVTSSVKFLTVLTSISIYLGAFAKYAFIIFYLLGKSDNSSITNEVVSQSNNYQTRTMINSNVQPILTNPVLNTPPVTNPQQMNNPVNNPQQMNNPVNNPVSNIQSNNVTQVPFQLGDFPNNSQQ